MQANKQESKSVFSIKKRYNLPMLVFPFLKYSTGDHKSELKNPVLLKDKVARFDKQVISVPTKLYWDEKKQEFLSKIVKTKN